MSLREILQKHRIVVCVGCGGVGKTTTSAALALHAALEGKRVLCLTIDPAKRLANSLGLQEMTTERQDVPAELFAAAGLQMNGSLSAMMLNAKSTFDWLVTRYASSPERAQRILDNRLYQYVSSSLAGTQEYMAMEKLYDVRRSADFDLIVLDTPPTSNALDFLDAPERLVAAIDSPAIRWFLQAFEGKGGFSFNLLGRGAALLFRGLSRFTGGEFLESVAAFVTDLNDLFGGFRERAAEVRLALRGPDVAFVIVTSPDPLALQEAGFFGKRLAELGIEHDAFVINGVHQTNAKDSDDPSSAAWQLREWMDVETASSVWPKLEQARRDQQTRAKDDHATVEAFRARAAKNVELVCVPALGTDVHDLATLKKISSYLVSENV